jgi:hypothetical protein
MHRLATALRRLMDWLAEPQPAPDHPLSPPDWFDLPTHHPTCTER